MKHCRAIFNLKEPSFSCVWVENTVPKAVHFPISIRETLADILHQREVKFSEEDLAFWLQTGFMKFVDFAWLEGRPRTLHPHPEIQMVHYLHWSGISVIENTVRSSKRMCELCVRYKKLYEEILQCPDSLVFTPRCSGAEREYFENDWMFPDRSSGSSFLQHAVNAVVDRIVDEFTRAAEARFSRRFFNRLHPGLLDPHCFPSLY